MAKNRQLGKLRITTWILAFVMMLASCALIFSACSNDTSEEDDTTETPTDTQTFANGDFEFFTDSDGSYLIGSPDNWTLSTQGSSSLSKSGIVDTSLNWGDKFVYAREQYEIQQDEDNTTEEPDEYYTDIDSDYDVPGWDIADANNSDEDTDITYENIDKASINAVNPGTHNAAAGVADEENGTHVLMLHNYRSNGYGTAARYASSSVTLQAGTAAKFSVWVKTYGMTYNENTAVNGNRGAYIEVYNTVGGTAQDSLVVRNIDTEKLNASNDNNGWVQYTFYVKASSYAATTFTVYLGLGRTNDVDSNNYEYVQGYAFFDDLEYEVMTADEYEDETASLSSSQKYTLDIYSTNAKRVDAVSSSYRTFALDLENFTNGLNGITIDQATVSPTTADRNGKTHTLADYIGSANVEKLTDDQDDDRSGVINVSDITDTAYPASVAEDFAKFEELFGNSQILMLYSGKGMPYTATLSQSDVTAADSIFTVAKDQTLMFSFWVKTSELNGGTGATVTVVDYETETTLGAVDTTTLDPVDLTDDNGTTEDIFDGWQPCYLYISNDTDNPLTFTLKFNFGPTDIADTTFDSYLDGYAAFTGFNYSYLTDEEAALISTGTYAVKVALTGSPLDSNSSVVFDDPAYTGNTEGSEAIRDGFADLANYDGVKGNSVYVGGEELSGKNQHANTDAEATESDLSTYAGLVNKDYAENYWNSAWLNAVLANYTDALTASTWWNEVLGSNTTQPLFIINTLQTAAEYSYGFVGTSSTISADSYTQVNLRVKLSEGAKAYIYLIDTTENADKETKYTDNLKYTAGVSYRYDTDGNVVTKDPDDKDFNKDSDTLFYKQDNGLWSTASRHSGDYYYANLANYDTDEDGNLIDTDGNIVYYLHDGEFYRYHDEDNDTYSVAVRDFTKADVDAADLTAATLQNLTESGKDLVQVIEGTAENANKWIYVNFFIANGSEEKNYRLEVWNGSRDNSETMAANSYVVFDQVSYSTLDESGFSGMLSESLLALGENSKLNGTLYSTEEEILDAYLENPGNFIEETADGTSLIYYHFSLYDSADYAPYDAENSLETRESAPYSDYDPSSYSDTVAYLKFNGSENGYTEYNTFVNYGASEIAVASSSDSTDDSTTDDTSGSGSTTNLWLLIPSIALAVALFVTLISLLVKRLLANIRKNKVKYAAQYDARRTRYIRKLKLAEAADDAKDENAPDVLPDEDEIDEEDIYRVDEGRDDFDPYRDESEEADGNSETDAATDENGNADGNGNEDNK